MVSESDVQRGMIAEKNILCCFSVVDSHSFSAEKYICVAVKRERGEADKTIFTEGD